MTEEDEIESKLREGCSFEDICKDLVTTDVHVREVAIRKLNRWVISADRRGRPELRQYIVAIRHADAPGWQSSTMLDNARRDYDAGMVELCQARDGNNIILYSIPRRVPVKRVHAYFARPV